jgi:small conductance mechanosensitive channel
LLEIAIAYREDVDRVVDVLHELGQEMLGETELAKDIMEPLFVQGVQRLDDSAVIIRARIKTTPGMQWSMRREFYRRMKKRFGERDIEIPFPHRTVYFGADQGGQAPVAHVRLET